jgi:large subunit ribosomal protein L25
MSKAFVLKADVREQTGSKAAARLRKNGRIPAIVYGHKKEPVAVSLDAHEFTEGLHHGHRVMDINIDGKKEKTLVKDLAYDHLGKNVLHADLMRIDVKEVLRVSVPIELKGSAAGAQEGGIIEEHTDHVEVECRATDIPESIVVSVKEMQIGDAIHAEDIEMPNGVKLASPPELLLVTCHIVAAAKTTEEVEEEAPAAPEVIGEKEAEEEEQAPEGEEK